MWVWPLLGLDGETEQQLKVRAECAGQVAQALEAACFQNHRVKELPADGHSKPEKIRKNFTVRVEF